MHDSLIGFSNRETIAMLGHWRGGTSPSSSVGRPLAARALEQAQAPLFVDLADSKAELRRFLDAHGFTATRPFTRMIYRSSTRFDNAARTFAVVGPEFG